MDKVRNPIKNPLWHIPTLDFDNQRDMAEITQRHWQKNGEYLWTGNIDRSYFNFQIDPTLCIGKPANLAGKVNYVHDRLDGLLKKFFRLEYYKFDIETIDVNSGVIPSLEQTCKLCYLLDEWLRKKSFRDPLCTHYNPRFGEHVVHPGGTRQVIIDLFQTTPVKTFYFNTGGFEFDFLSKLKKISIQEVIEQHQSWIGLVPDHGTLIPHIMNVKADGTGALPSNMIKFHNQYKSKLTNPNYKIYANKEISYLKNWQTTDSKEASVVIKFKKSSSDNRAFFKATLLALSGRNYSDSEITVIHRNNS